MNVVKCYIQKSMVYNLHIRLLLNLVYENVCRKPKLNRLTCNANVYVYSSHMKHCEGVWMKFKQKPLWNVMHVILAELKSKRSQSCFNARHMCAQNWMDLHLWDFIRNVWPPQNSCRHQTTFLTISIQTRQQNNNIKALNACILFLNLNNLSKMNYTTYFALDIPVRQ